MSIVIIGSIAFDDVETPTSSVENVLAGSATYLSLTARFFVNRPKVIGVVGGDFKDEHFHLFKSNDIDISGLEVVPSGKTFRWKGHYHEDMNIRETIYTHLNVFADFHPKIPSSFYPIKFLSLGNIDPDLQFDILKKSKADFVIADTMDLWIETKTDRLKQLIKEINCLVINDSEAKQLTGELNVIRSGRAIQRMGCDHVIIKKGEHGAILFSHEEIFTCTSFPVEGVKDPTGAGDCFAGGVIGHIASTGDTSFSGLKQGVLYGTVCASFCIEAFGTDKIRSISKEDIENRLDLFRKYIST